jgi:hypothetical protein
MKVKVGKRLDPSPTNGIPPLRERLALRITAGDHDGKNASLTRPGGNYKIFIVV